MDVTGSAPEPGMLVSQPTWIARMEVPPVIKRFVDKEYHFEHYKCLAECAEQEIRKAMQNQGMQLWKTTSRAKTHQSLQEKLMMRNEKKNYKSSEDIEKDVVDFAGVRIILYMPTDEVH